MTAAWLASVVALAFVMAATPGPNNILFAAAGARSGYRRTLPMLGGMLAGFVVLVALAAAGAGRLVELVPGASVALTASASAYMLYLALRLWRAPAPAAETDAAAPLMAWWQMALFQLANPKTWLAVLAFTTGKLGPNGPGGAAADALAVLCFLATVWVSASTWTLFGTALRARLQGDGSRRAMRSMAALAVATVPTFWW